MLFDGLTVFDYPEVPPILVSIDSLLFRDGLDCRPVFQYKYI